jgi:hypothetical protein
MPQRVTYESILVHNIFVLFGCEIECADAEGESLELCLCESCLFEHLHHDLALRECLDGLIDITVGAPVSFPMKQLFSIYSNTVLPMYGKLISKDQSAYSYLNKTIEAFPQGEVMMEVFKKAGFAKAEFKRLTFGICTLYFATK